jgi:hypothetical protein
MTITRRARGIARCAALGLGVAAAGYAVLVAMAWRRYGRAVIAKGSEGDPILDRFMPLYDVAERHHIRVAASAAATLEAAAAANFQQSAIVQAIIRTRELVLGVAHAPAAPSKGLLADMQAMGWRILAEEPGREIVMGAVTQPWRATVTFLGFSPQAFTDFREPGYVKIAWTLRADPIDDGATLFRTETRVVATDAQARARFRWYWARFSPGIIVIRKMLLPQVKRTAEGRSSRVHS